MPPVTIDALILVAHAHGWQIVANRETSSWHRKVSLLKKGLKIDVTLKWPAKMDRREWEVSLARVSNGHFNVTVNTDHLNTLRKFIVRDDRTFRL